MGDTEVQHRNPKHIQFGLEVPKALTYHGWEPGGEYTKSLIIRNVQIKTQKIRYKISGGHFSSTLYPQPITLSAGTSYTLPVTFRPSQKNPYEEFVEIGTVDGAFRVPILAPLPTSNLSIPECLKFGMCAVGDSVTVNFSVHNTSTLTVDFNWDCSNGFEIRPKSGSLAPKGDIYFSATFSPQRACVYDIAAVCSYGNENPTTKSMNLEGVGKYPHVLVRLAPPPTLAVLKGKGGEGEEGAVAQSELTVNFGCVPVGAVSERLVEIVNMSPVPSRFTVTAVAPGPLCDPVFASEEYEGAIEPGGSHRLKLLLSPSLATPHPLVGHFRVCAVGGVGSSMITCTGLVEGPKLVLEESYISFGNLECGKVGSGVLHIRNDSSVPAIFQLQIDLHGVFHAEVLCGLLGPRASQAIIVYFSPTKPIPYYRRVACLVHHQEPQFFNLVGTGFTETVRPVSLQPSCIERYIAHAQRGLTSLPPEQLKEYHIKDVLSSDSNGSILPKPGFQNPHPQPLSRSVPEGSSGYATYLSSEMDPSGFCHISVDTEALKFGYCTPNHVSEGKVVNVTNHTNGIVTCVWMPGPGEPFRVVPEERDIPAGTTASFTITFRPHTPSQLYVRWLECFTFYKTLRDYRLVEPMTITPPWCLPVTFDSRNLVFPATLPGEASFRTAMVRNSGDMPVMFDFACDASGAYTVKPSHGLLQDGYQVFVLQLNPQEPRAYKQILKCRFNDRDHFDQELLLSGAGEVAVLELGNKGQLFFKPTCVQTTSESSCRVTNASRLPVRFEWKIPEEAMGVLAVEPANGIIDPGEIQKHQWRFCPLKKGSYAFRASIQGTFSGDPKGNHPLVKKFKGILSLMGEGCLGTMKCDPAHLECPTMVVGTSWPCPLSLINTGPCTLHYRLFVVEEKGGRATSILDSQGGKGTVTLSDGGGVVHAHSRVSVTATVRPSSKLQGKWLIKYELITSHGEPLDTIAFPDFDPTLCTLTVSASYPVLSVRDLWGVGVASSLPKTMLRSMLSIDQLNTFLHDDPSSSELRYAIGTRHSMTRRVSVGTTAMVDFDFGAAPLEMGTSGFDLVLKNHGDVPTEWAFQFPTDVLLEPEYWADTGQLDEEERHELSVMDHDLFTVAPKKGRLGAGESAVISCSFKHTAVGSSRLPVLFKLNRGREVLLRWRGMTLERGQPFIHFVSHCHKFSPVPIGLQSYPRQDYELYNAGDTTVSFEIDVEPLRALKEHNYEMPIIECTQPSGDIAARSSATVHFVFSPLEAKVYSVDLPVTFSNGEMRLVTFTGEGYGSPDDIITQHPPPPHNLDKQKTMGASDVPAVLSISHLAFSDVVLFSVTRRVVFVTNTTDHTLSFNWELESSGVLEVLSIQPGCGYLQPKQSVACKFSFCSHLAPAIYDLELVCRVLDESEMASYRLKLEAWQKAEEEKKNTFAIIDVSTKSPSSKSTRRQTVPRLKSLGKRSRSSDGELRRKYEALPPIGCPLEETYEEWKKKDLAARGKHRPRKRTSETQVPRPPQPSALPLRLTGHTHAMSDYSKLFKGIDSLHMDLIQPTLLSPRQEEEGLRVEEEENTTLRIVLSQMIRDLLEDSNFLSAVQRVVEEPVPYFQQFSTLWELGGKRAHSAHAHMYAAGHHDPLLDTPPGALIRHSPFPPVLNSQSELSNTEDAIGKETGDKRDDVIPHNDPNEVQLNRHIKLIPEFTSFVENILENTLLNILKEANSGELSISGPLYRIANTPPSLGNSPITA
ncbi:hypothetical protein EMCRGX_G018573 [Ephydatia muelleri]